MRTADIQGKLTNQSVGQLTQILQTISALVNEENRSVQIEFSLKIAPVETKPSDWLSLAQSYLSTRVRQKDYRGLSIELRAMENAGICRRLFAPTTQQLATTLSQILGWQVTSRNLAQRIDDLDEYKLESQLQLSEKFWREKIS